MGLFVRFNLIQDYKLEIIERANGILGILFTHKGSGYCFIIFTGYLPPENSPWGRDASIFFNTLLSQIYQFSEVDSIFFCGDLNARIGNMDDFISDMDFLPMRAALDDFVNKHGETLIEFLKDARMCVVNGRIDPLYDNFTSISPKGKAVVDYIIAPYDCLENCVEFKVISASQAVESCALTNLIGDRCRLPDHSLLTFKFRAGNNVDLREPTQSHAPVSKATKRVMRKVPTTFFNSEPASAAASELIGRLQTDLTQGDMDEWYDEFCMLIHSELIAKGDRPKYRKSTQNQPYWNSELDVLWAEMRNAERIFLRCRERNLRDHYRLNYKQKQYDFDKRARLYKRKYQRGQIMHLDHIQTGNPNLFWSEINKLGPKRSKMIPMQVWYDGEISSDIATVLKVWETSFAGLFARDLEHFDWNYDCLQPIQINVFLNRDIERLEVVKAINSLKDKKALGVENLPNEVLKNPKLTDMLYNLVKTCFDKGIIPSVWSKSIITPIPKSPKDDPKVPLNYRGISLLSTVYKLYSLILNRRLVEFLEYNNLLAEEQNGFRKGRACIDHVYTVTTVIRNRMKIGLPTFCCYIDFCKAFDFISRDLLKYKLYSNGVNGRFFEAINAIYYDPIACVKVNDYFTEWFTTPSGVKQGDVLSPSLFALFINDLVTELKTLGKGIWCGGLFINCLLYADDIILVSENEIDLQSMLACVAGWCKKWCLSINYKKTQVMHFRKRGRRSTFSFFIEEQPIEFTDKYKYLGLFLDEHLSFLPATSVLADSASRALGGIIGKTKCLRDLGYQTYSKLFSCCVCPILDYMAGIWGYKNFNKNVQVQNRAIRYFLGLHKFAPTLVLNAEMGWDPCEVRCKSNMIALWNRLVNLPPDRLASQMFHWDLSANGEWASEISDLLVDTGLHDSYVQRSEINLEVFKSEINLRHTHLWLEQIKQKPKLRTYCLLKIEPICEQYISFNLPKSQRSLCAQLRCGILPLSIETGRYRGSPEEDRICEYCDLHEVENEFHFVLYCPFYHDLRYILFEKIKIVDLDFVGLGDPDILRILFNCPFAMGEFLSKAWNRRRRATFEHRTTSGP